MHSVATLRPCCVRAARGRRWLDAAPTTAPNPRTYAGTSRQGAAGARSGAAWPTAADGRLHAWWPGEIAGRSSRAASTTRTNAGRALRLAVKSCAAQTQVRLRPAAAPRAGGRFHCTPLGRASIVSAPAPSACERECEREHKHERALPRTDRGCHTAYGGAGVRRASVAGRGEY